MNPLSHSASSDQELSREFQRAAERVASLEPADATPQMHTLYGLYKQATDGDHDTFRGEVGQEEHDNPDGPAGLSQGQWDSWSQFKGLSRADAMRRYITEVEQLPASSPTPDAGSATPDLGQMPPSAGSGGPEALPTGMGLRGDLRAGTPYGSEEELKEEGSPE